MNVENNNSIESFKELLRRVEFTSKARYNAARRLNLHSKLSQWTLAVLALGQITISLIPSLNLHSNYNSAYVNFGSLFFGALVLTYSLLIGMSNFSTRSYVMHDCGIALGHLARELHIYSRDSNSSAEKYFDCTKKYYEILCKCENHSHQDYLNTNSFNLLSEIKKLEKVDFKFLSKINDYIINKISSITFKFMEFLHYFVTMMLMFVWIFKMIF